MKTYSTRGGRHRTDSPRDRLVPVRVVGLQRSGTTWLECLLTNNYEAIAVNSHKHNMPGEWGGWRHAVATLAIRKHPDNWLSSICRNKATLREMRPELYPDGRLDAAAALALWAEFYRAWDAMPDTIPMQYERLLNDTQGIMGEIAAQVGLARGVREWDNNGPTWDKMSDAKRDFYLKRGIWAPRNHCPTAR